MPSSCSLRNTGSGPGPSSALTSRAEAPPKTGRSPASWGSGRTLTPRWADALLAELRRNDPGALQRLRAYVPRYVAATVAATAELRDGHPVAFIDFDTVHPGPRIWDVAYAAYRFVPLADSHREDDIPPVQEQARRLRLFADAYRLGDADRSALTDTARARLDHLIRHMHDQADAGNAAFAAHIAAGDETLYRTDAAHIARHQAVFHTALTTPASE